MQCAVLSSLTNKSTLYVQVETLGRSVCDLASSCVQHSHLNSAHHHDPHTTQRSKSCKTQSKLNHIIEMELMTKIKEWLETCSTATTAGTADEHT